MVLVIDAVDVERVLDYPTAIGAVEDAFRDLGSGKAVMPVRLAIRVEPHDGMSSFMPAYLSGKNQLGIKIVSGFQRNKEKFGLPTVVGSILLLDARNGSLMSIIDGTSVTAIRTAAASAVATRHMAREDATTLGIFGAGVQGETHILAIPKVRKISKVLVTSPDVKKCEEFCARLSVKTGLKIRVALPKETASSDIVVTATNSKTPVIDGDWVSKGAHVNGIGSHTPATRELDDKIVTSSRVVVDSMEANLKEAGDLLIPIAESRFAKDRIYAELADIVLGRKKGRESQEEITLFKSVGIAIEDISVASAVYERAKALNTGRNVEM